jgi:NitT/TauT family transport system substrate-binding protein
MMKKIHTIFISMIIALLAVSLLIPQQVLAEPLKLAHSTWVGYGPFYIARDKGFFEEEGVEVKLIIMENTSLKMGALMAGKIDAVASTADEFPIYMKPGKLLYYILAVDNSKGGDGIVSNKDIKTVADLKGKKVACEVGSVSQFFLNALLRESGLTQKDVNMINMTATDAGVAFVAKRVDAAVTWEPHLSKGASKEHGHILIDSSTKPGLIVDVVAIRADTMKNREAELKAFVRAWERALKFIDENPNEAYKIMAKGVGGWLKDPAVFAETLPGIEYLTIKKNQALFGTPDKPGTLYKTLQFALDIWSDFGRVQVDAKPSDIIEDKFINQ